MRQGNISCKKFIKISDDSLSMFLINLKNESNESNGFVAY